MRLKQLAISTIVAAALALQITDPVFAQTTAPAITTAPATTTTAPAKPVAASPTATAVPASPTATVAPVGKVVGNKPIKATKTPFTGIVSVNSGSPAELKKLKGIGPTRAKAIKAGRPYKAIDELDSKQIIPHGVYQNIKAQLTL